MGRCIENCTVDILWRKASYLGRRTQPLEPMRQLVEALRTENQGVMVLPQAVNLWGSPLFADIPRHLQNPMCAEEALWLAAGAELCLREMPRPELKPQLRQYVRRSIVGE